MRKITRLALLAIIPLGLFAARLTMRDGTVINGRFISGAQDRIVFQDDSGIRRTFYTRDIQGLDFNNYMQPAAPYTRENSANRYNDNNYNNNNYNNYGERGNMYATLPPGSMISVRTDATINADTATSGQTYPASIYQDVLDSSGNVVMPRGSRANLVVRQVNEGGAFRSGSLVLDLESVQVGGRRYRVDTEDIMQSGSQGIGANRRTGEMVGGGAVLGTLLGAIAGGGKGAAIGALAGAAVGGGVQVATKGNQIRVPAETVLNFRLDQPLTLREARY